MIGPLSNEHTLGYQVLRADIEATTWQEIVAVSGLARHAIESAADVYANARNVIVCYGRGIKQHAKGTYNVQQIANLLMLRGNIGREGAGIAPIRGHSNMQGDRTVGITEIPNNALLDGMERAFGFRPPSKKGHNAIEAVEAAIDGRAKALICLDGPDFHHFNNRVRKPGGFRLDVAASFRRWNTPERKANFLLSPGLSEDTPVGSEGVLLLPLFEVTINITLPFTDWTIVIAAYLVGAT